MNQEKDATRCDEWRFGSKKMYAIIEGNVTVRTDCDVFEGVDCCLKIKLTLDQWERLKKKDGLTQDILSEHPASVREVFISGTTPAEFIELFGGVRLTQAQMRALGYEFDEAELPDDERFADWQKTDPMDDPT